MIDPIALEIGPIQLHWYGIIIATAVLVAALVTWLIVRSGILDTVERRIAERRRNLRAFVVSLVFVVASTLLTLPWTLYADYFREKSYGRTSQPLGDWLGQTALAASMHSHVVAVAAWRLLGKNFHFHLLN